MKRATSRTGVFSSLIVAGTFAGLVGCSASSTGEGSAIANEPQAPSTTATAAAQPATRVAAVAPNAKSGRVRMIADILSTVALTDEQRTTIEALASDADARHQAEMQAHEDLMTALSAQIEAGKIDRTALQPKLDAAAAAMKAGHPADQAALTKLHDLLTPAQRGQVADALESRHKEMAENHPHAGGGHHDHLAKLAADLNLTEAQKAQVAAVFASHRADRAGHTGDFKAMHERMAGRGQRFAESFRGETLTFPEPPADAKGHGGMMGDHMITMAESIVPILTPEQRKLAATKLFQHGPGAPEAPAPEEAPLPE